MADDNSDAVIDALDKAVQRILIDLADRMVQVAKEHAPTKLGNLRRSVQRTVPQKNPDGWEIEWGAMGTGVVAIAQEWGTAERGEPFAPRPTMVSNEWPRVPPGKRRFEKYPILPKTRKALRWTVPVAKKSPRGRTRKKEVFAKAVWHPGVPPTGFMRGAIDIVRLREAETIIARAIERELSKLRLR